MHQSPLPSTGFILGLCILGSILGLAPLALAQEIEPNNTCPTAQDVGTVALPFTLEGSLDSPPTTPDVDFFRLTGTPGSTVRVDLEGQATKQGTLKDPVLGVFDAFCNLITSNDDSEGTLNARLLVVIPSDGVVVLAATSHPDFGFTGIGSGGGTYQLTVTPFLAISISGRVVDADTGTPLPGDTFPFAVVELRRCSEELGCDISVAAQPTDSEGRFQFSLDFNGLPLDAGTYQVIAFAGDYRGGKTARFEVGEGEDRDIGDIPLQSLFLVAFSDIQPCEDLPPEGGQCRYSVRVTNRQSVPLQGAAWSLVEGFDLGSPVNFTRFQPQSPHSLTLDPEESSVVQFDFQVPSTVREGAFICTQVFVGQGDSPFFATVGRRDLFCISKGMTGFLVMSEEEVKELRQQVDERSFRPPKTKGGLAQSPKHVP
jgi:hypothetical protein